jgi:prolyl oligopeptidase PreP (S9A serine peptidase family)
MDISKIREIMAQEGIVFSFSGMISQSLTSFMVETAKSQLEERGEDAKLTHNMFSIAIEQLQNIMSYSKDKNTTNGSKYVSPGVMVIGIDEKKEKYYVNSSNEIVEADKIKIGKKIDSINSLEKSELRKHLREKLRSAEDTHDRGAGVGFIEMAKRSSEKLEYDFEEIDSKLYFHIKAYI